MSPRLRQRRAPLLAAGLAVAALLGTAVHGDVEGAPDLAVADAYGYATPVATVLRIPNRLDGGALLSKTTLTLDKAQAVAAGYTPGELGEAFLRTSIVAPDGSPDLLRDSISYSNPTLVTAQTPPSEVFPAEAALADGGVDSGGLRAASVRAATTPTSATASAAGGVSAEQGDLRFSSAGSEATSQVLEDGTVVSESHAFVTDLRLADDVLRIAEIRSVATVSLRPGSEPVTELDITVSGAQVAGIPVRIDRSGVRLAETGLLSDAELRTVNEALASLADQGLTVTLFPGVREGSDAQSGEVAGAALSIRGDLTGFVPTAFDTPLGPLGSPFGDVGTDDELLLGQVEASVFAAPRAPFPGGALPSASVTPLTPIDDRPEVAVGAPRTAPATPTAPGADAVAPSPTPATEVAGPGGAPFELVRRTGPPGVEALRVGYRWVLLAALTGSVALLARRRARLV